ncbi:MAG: hypothetical protein AAFU71_19665, partial [Cyanobacteria bacterium J06632_22]
KRVSPEIYRFCSEKTTVLDVTEVYSRRHKGPGLGFVHDGGPLGSSTGHLSARIVLSAWPNTVRWVNPGRKYAYWAIFLEAKWRKL